MTSGHHRQGTQIHLVAAIAALSTILFAIPADFFADEPKTYAELRVLDAQTGRGVPLVELETVNHLRFVTDNAGRIAFHEPGLMDREIYFTVKSHGYSIPKDGFGFAGVRVTPQAGKIAEIKVTRHNLAERLCRLTGEGLYRDSELLGYRSPIPRDPGGVAGQDSVQAAIYRDRVYYFWGDTLRLNYPLGLFRVAGATTPIPDEKFDPADGIAYRYFVDKSGFARALMPLPERPEGVIWVESVFTVADDSGTLRLVGHYQRRKNLATELEQGIAIWNDDKEIFEPARQLPLTEKWRHPHGPPIEFDEDGTKWLLFGSPSPNVRVPAKLNDVLNPDKYQALSDDEPRWRSDAVPLDSAAEFARIKKGTLRADQARFVPADADGNRIVLHRGSVHWNAHRKKWILIATQFGGKSSHLGEVWFAEADHPTGPFLRAVKIVTHERQTFYNVVQHPFLNRGRLVYFEGTYTNDFSGNPERTPRYNYNQILYRLDLDAEALKWAR